MFNGKITIIFEFEECSYQDVRVTGTSALDILREIGDAYVRESKVSVNELEFNGMFSYL